MRRRAFQLRGRWQFTVQAQQNLRQTLVGAWSTAIRSPPTAKEGRQPCERGILIEILGLR